MAALGIDPDVLRVAVLHEQVQVGDRLLAVALAVDQEHRRRRSLQHAARKERKTGAVGEELVHRPGAVDRGARRVDVEKILAGREGFFLPLGRVVLVDADAVHHRAAQAVLLGVRHDRRPVPAPAASLHDDALRVDLRPRLQVVERAREHALGADVDQDRRLARAGHVEREHADAVLQVGIGLRDDFFLARVEAVDAEHERRGPHVRRQAQIGDDLRSLERDAQRLDRRCERSRVLLERLEGARVGALLAGRKPLARPARDVEAVPGLVIVAALQMALADAAPRRRPFVGL